MSIELRNASVTIEERTVEVRISTAFGRDPTITVLREVVTMDQDGTLLGRTEAPAAGRKFSQIYEQTVFAGDLKLSAGQLAMAISAMADAWRQEDIAAELAPPPPPEPGPPEPEPTPV